MTSRPTCIQCGTRFLLTKNYKGNYCPDCHREWVEQASSKERQRPASRTPTGWRGRGRERGVWRDGDDEEAADVVEDE